MTYFKLNNKDLSSSVSELKVNKVSNNNVRYNLVGKPLYDFINIYYEVKVTFIPMDNNDFALIAAELNKSFFNVSFLNPFTDSIFTYSCASPDAEIDYYRIGNSKRSFKLFTVTFLCYKPL